MACQLLVISSGSLQQFMDGYPGSPTRKEPQASNSLQVQLDDTSKFHCAGHQEKPHVCVYINTYDTYV